MKYYSITIALILITTVLFSFKKKTVAFEKYNYSIAHLKNASGSPTGRTGAPGESTCTSCHSGAAQSGTTENAFLLFDVTTLPVTQYVPGQTYAVSISMNSNPSKKGFQATALDVNGNMAGIFTAGLNTSVNGTTRKYANHKSTSNNAATTAWMWSWTAPSTNVGDVTFYVATNKANGNNNDNGDVIYLSQHVIGSTLGIDDQQIENSLVVGLSNDNSVLNINFNALSAYNLFFNLIDGTGKSVYTKDLGTASVGTNKHKILLPTDLKSGVYFVHLFIGNKAIDKKILL